MEYTTQKLLSKRNPANKGKKNPPPVKKNTKRPMGESGLTGQAGKAAKAIANRNKKMKSY